MEDSSQNVFPKVNNKCPNIIQQLINPYFQQAYKQVIPDARYDEIEARAADKKKGKDQSSQQDANPCVLPFQICLMKSDGTFPALPAIPETGADTKSGAAKERIFPASSAAMKVNRLLLFLLVMPFCFCITELVTDRE